MGKIKEPLPACLVCACMGPTQGPWQEVRRRLETQFGPVVMESPSYPFHFSRYYEKEMGRDLIKFLWAFEPPFPREDLARAKIFTNALEEELGRYREGRLCRVVNLDPGYLTDAQLVLASTKDYSHRIYLGQGIHAEVTLIYRQGTFLPLEWTYPDYRTPLVLGFLEEARRMLLEWRRQKGG